MAFCDDCGLLFQNVHDLQRHVNKWCPEEEEDLPMKRKQDHSIVDIPPTRSTIEYKQQVSMEGGENEETVYVHLMQLSKNSNEELWQEK